MKPMRHFVNARSCALLLCAALALACAAGCGDKEPEQRKAFIEILQKNILDQPGTRIRMLTEADKKAIGPYEAHYAVLVEILERDRAGQKPVDELHRQLDRTVRCNGAEECTEALDALDVALKEVGAMLEAGVNKAQADKAALQQPDDLKAVYDQAFERLFGPERLALEAHEFIVEMAASARSINEFILANPDKVTYERGNILILDDSAESKVKELLEAQTEAAGKLNAMQDKLNQFLNRR